MSDREKKLLLFFGIAGFAILNFLGFNLAQAQRLKVDRDQTVARDQLNMAEMFRESSAQVTDQMEWLAKHEPAPIAPQDAQTKLQQLAEKFALSNGLTIKSQKPLPTDTTGVHYHIAQIQFVVTGQEEALYRWFDQINVPDQFRIASQIRLSPDTKDDTKIDCTVTVQQWFVSLAP
jgi:beta-galactosidase beta subunit